MMLKNSLGRSMPSSSNKSSTKKSRRLTRQSKHRSSKKMKRSVASYEYLLKASVSLEYVHVFQSKEYWASEQHWLNYKLHDTKQQLHAKNPPSLLKFTTQSDVGALVDQLNQPGECSDDISSQTPDAQVKFGPPKQQRKQCSYCDYSCTDVSNLTRHLRTHTGEKPFSCDTCGKSFSQRVTLTRHVLTHTGDKPHACPHCQSSFARLSSLTEHLRTHSEDKPFFCDTCGKSYAHKNTLTDHVRLHTGVMPYSCEVCGKRFTTSRSCNRHTRCCLNKKKLKTKLILKPAS